MKQVLGDECRGGEDHLIGAPGPVLFADPPSGVHGFDLVTAVGQFANVDDACHRVDLCARLFGEVQVILFKGVLGMVRASADAMRAEDAAGAVWSDAAEVRVGHRLAGLAEKIHPPRLGETSRQCPNRPRWT